MPDDLAGLTTAESLIWAGQRLDPQSPLYNMALVLDVRAALDPGLLQRALQQVVDADAVLRTVIRDEDGKPRREILEHVEAALDVVERTGEEGQATALQLLLEAWTAERLPLSNYLWRARLIRCGPGRTVLYLLQHHIAADAWSMSNLFKRWGAAYEQLARGISGAPAAVHHFAEHVAAEHRLRQSPRLAAARAFWEDLDGVRPSGLTFYGRSMPGSGQTCRVRVPIGAERAVKLQHLAGQTPFRALTSHQSRYFVFATVLAAWLHRVADTGDVVFGCPWHNRSSAALRESLGMFVELHPLRVRVEQAERWRDLAAKVAGFTMRAARHVIPGAASARGAREFQVVMNYVTAGVGTFGGHAAHANWVHSGFGDRQHKLRLQVHDFDASGEPVLDFDLDETVFDERARQWAVEHFLRLLDALLDDPDGAIDDRPLVSWEEEARFAARGADRDSPTTIVAAFQAQAARTPDAIALIDGARELSYRQLLALANRLGESLAARGVGPGATVGLLLGRSAELLVVMLGVLTAGAAYVPLDPDHPDERLRAIARDAALDLVLAEPGQGARAREWLSDPSLVIDVPQAADTPASAALSSLSLPEPDALAYVLYTSGSTGIPKGVEVTHGALADYVAWAARSYTDGAAARFPLFTSPAFDLTVTSLFTPLVTGGTVVVYRNGPAGASFLVRQLFEDDQVDIVKLTPAHLTLLRDLDLRHSRVRRLIVGGENLASAVAARAHAALGGRAELVNEYGPTEATVGCMIHRFDPERDTGDAVPIGGPADNVRIHLLDHRGHPVPPGCRGEIHIGGRRLARGYRGDAERTARAFVHIPGAPDPVLYKTGDVARQDAQGRLEFLGRSDGQVKVRGVRIELGEVEAALRRHPAMLDVVVHVLRTPDPSVPATRLVAYYTSSEQPAAAVLRRHLAALLPAEAVPTAFVQLRDIPLTANGKVDYRALPLPAAGDAALGNATALARVVPATDTERQLVAIWGEVLGRTDIGTTDDFFELGGDSMHCLRIVAVARDRGLRFEPHDLFARPTVVTLAAFVDAGRGATGASTDSVGSDVPRAATLSAEELAELQAEFDAP